MKWLERLPVGLFTILTGMLILWLTLSPDPLGKNSPRLFPGADKVAHALMFGFLTVIILFDNTRRHSWHPVTKVFIIFAIIISTLSGCLIEVAQLKMDLGRGFEYTDMVADFIGSLLCGLGWMLAVNPHLPFTVNNYHDERSR